MKYFLLFALIIASGISFGQSNDKYRKGHYYDLENNKIEGLIYYGFSHKTFFLFKKGVDIKPVKVKAFQSNGFVMEADSFTVIKNFEFEGVGGGLNPMGIDFGQVIDSGPVTLYKHFSTQGNPGPYSSPYGLENYLIKKEGGTLYITIRKRSQKKFKEQMAILLKDRIDLLEKVHSGAYTWKDTPDIIRAINTGVSN